jgi:3-hydroxyisobutyrate dehydrogenase-like beta-hydroxyacid dehydrogenase
MSDHVKLGYIGLGNQGAPMAKRYLDWPGGLTVFDVRADAMTPFVEGGATAAASVAEVADADIISITVLNDAQVREVVAELASHAKPGTIIAIHSTISHTTAVELAEELRPQGIHIADAPVSGGGKAADKGELAVVVGADDETFSRIKEPFSKWASVVIHAGEPGDGTKMKLARNMLTFIIYSAVGESQKLADEAGLNLDDLAKVVRHSDALTGGASSIMYRSDSKPLAPDHFLYQPFLHTRALGEKDLSLALELGESLSVDLPFTRLALEKFAANLGVPHTGTETSKES